MSWRRAAAVQYLSRHRTEYDAKCKWRVKESWSRSMREPVQANGQLRSRTDDGDLDMEADR